MDAFKEQRKMTLTRDELNDLYSNKKMSAPAIGKHIGVSRKTVEAWLKLYGIPTRASLIAQSRPSCDELRRLYLDEGLTTHEIAARIGSSATTIGEWLKVCEIPLRPANNGLISRGITPPTKEELQHLVHGEYLTYFQIASIYGVDFTAVPHWLKKHGIVPPKKGKLRTSPTKEELQALYDVGESLETIAKHYKLTAEIIRAMFIRYAIPLRPDGWQAGKRYTCKSGLLVRSIYEQRVGDWLFDQSIPHEYEPSLPCKGTFKSDFLANGWYIEIWGVTQNADYNARRKRKTDLYKMCGLPLIELAAHTFNCDQNNLWIRRLQICLKPPDAGVP